MLAAGAHDGWGQLESRPRLAIDTRVRRRSCSGTASEGELDSGGFVDGVVVEVSEFVGLAGLQHGPGATGELAGDGAVGLRCGCGRRSTMSVR